MNDEKWKGKYSIKTTYVVLKLLDHKYKICGKNNLKFKKNPKKHHQRGIFYTIPHVEILDLYLQQVAKTSG
jgi:hypothetical protein